MKRLWWKEGIVYQIYPKSFYDTNGDGIGDIKGIIEKLDYIKELGADIIWLNPVYKSPNDDNGYDISDYMDIIDEFGTMKDWEELLNGMHKRGIKLIMDLVVNHTSDEHNWFIEAKKSKNSKYRDYYFFRDGKDSGDIREPNNWNSVFGGSAWKYDKEAEAYFLHIFSKKQPDLNWDNKDLREDIFEMMKWWLDKGIDGFRMDVINFIGKNPELPDAGDKNRYSWGGEYFMNTPKIHSFLKEMNEKVLSKYDVMTVGECPGADVEEGLKYVGDDRKELNMIFQFEHMSLDSENGKWNVKDWKLTDLKKVIGKWQKGMHEKGWNSLYLMNHDQPRSVSRFGNDKKFRKESAKLLALFNMTLQGTPYIYQGEEIGMTNIKFDKIDDYRDLESLNYYNEAIENGIKKEDILKSLNYMSRDNSRTPMQWNNLKNGGFTTGTPWISVNDNYKEINVEEAKNDKDSILTFYKEMIKIRKENLCLVYGDYIPLDEENENVYSYFRILENEKYFIVLNFTAKNVIFEYKEEIKGSIIISNYKRDKTESIKKLELKPYEAIVFKINV